MATITSLPNDIYAANSLVAGSIFPEFMANTESTSMPILKRIDRKYPYL
jgi:hypothetical protein